MAATNLEVWQQGKVIAKEFLSPTICEIRFSQSNPAKAEPGSHLDLMIEVGGQSIRRSYSIVRQSEDLKEVTISVLRTRNSRGGSIAMHELEVGQSLDITQPIQNFPLRFGAERYILLAGGIGITAVVAMAKALAKAKADYRFIYVVKSRPLAVFLDELKAEHGDRLQLFVDDEENPLSVAELVSAATPGTELYMCGPIRLMDEVRRIWHSKNLDITNLRYETFGAGGWFDPEPFTVKVLDRGIELTVGANQSMLEAMEAQGLEVMADCRKGECGLCELKVKSHQGKLDHRDVFYSEHQKQTGDRITTCVSRVASDSKHPEISILLG